MSMHPTYTAQMDTRDGYGTLRITLHGRYRAEQHFQTIAGRLLASEARRLRIIDTIVTGHQQRTYRIAPTGTPQH